MQTITVESTINTPVAQVWTLWTSPEHIKNWNTASEDWYTTHAENDLRAGGSFSSRMEAKDGSFGFDFNGSYDVVNLHEHIAYTIADGRKVTITFSGSGNTTKITETFEAENTNPLDMQRGGWQAILDNFKKYAESN